MYVHRLDDSYTVNENTIITIGNYDGLHRGHSFLLNKLTSLAKKYALSSVLVTFNPHTKSIIKDPNFKVITTFNDKINLAKKLNIDFLCEVNFDKNIKDLNFKDFINLIISKYNPSIILFGYDNKIGKNRIGSYEVINEYLKDSNIKIIECDEYKSSNSRVTTSVIKENIINYNIRLANKLLGRNYLIKGKIVKGESKGKKIGFPTANVEINSFEQLIPPNGVYSVTLKVGNNKYNSICNIGYCPTIKDNSKIISIEVHVINHNLQLYNKNVEVEFVDFIRKEKTFKSEEDLVNQIKKDILKVNLKG